MQGYQSTDVSRGETMTKAEFLQELERELAGVNAQEREEALKFYREFFEEAGEAREEEVLRELGSPHRIANLIRVNLGTSEEESESFASAQPQTEQSAPSASEPRSEGYAQPPLPPLPAVYAKKPRGNTIGWIILIIVTFPIWSGIIFGLFGAVMGIAGGIIGIAFGSAAFAIQAIFTMLKGIPELIHHPFSGFFNTGISVIRAALGIGMTALCVWGAATFIPFCVRSTKKLFAWISEKVGL